MQKATEVTAAIKAAWQKARELVHTTSIYVTADTMQVHVSDMRDLEQIPGEVEFKQFMPEGDYPWEAVKTHDGVKFFVLLTQEDYEAVTS